MRRMIALLACIAPLLTGCGEERVMVHQATKTQPFPAGVTKFNDGLYTSCYTYIYGNTAAISCVGK